MTCPACGTPAVPGARFCFSCGTALRESAAADLTAERRVVTVLFGDLSDFTSWSEELDPERVGVVTDRVLSTLIGGIAGGALIGWLLDKWLGTGHLLLVVMMVLGTVAGFWSIIKMSTRRP